MQTAGDDEGHVQPRAQEDVGPKVGRPTPRLRKLYDTSILILSVYVLVQLSLEVVLSLPEPVTKALQVVDLAICCVFLVDWVVLFAVAPDKWQYTKRRFIDLAASLPYVQVLRPLRLLRIVRLARGLRLIRGAKGLRPVLSALMANPARSTLVIYLSVTVVVFFYCALGIYNFEKGMNEGIRSFGDVIWMSFITMTSVGYGDIYPRTTGGRIMAAVLVLTGMGLFSLLTAEFATYIIRRARGAERKEE